MKTLLALVFLAATAVPAAAGADFISVTPTAKLAASNGTRQILPTDDVVFENDSAALLSSGLDQVATIAHWMKNNPRERVVLEGHTDSLGPAAHNRDLAARRARQVRLHLMVHGIPSDRIMIVVFGESEAQPVPNPIDRRVIVYATHDTIDHILVASLGRGTELSASWTRHDVPFTVTRGARMAAAVAAR